MRQQWDPEELIACWTLVERDRVLVTEQDRRDPAGVLAKKTEFGYVQQICEITENTTGARGYLLPPATAPGNPSENTLLPATLAHADTPGSSSPNWRSTR